MYFDLFPYFKKYVRFMKIKSKFLLINLFKKQIEISEFEQVRFFRITGRPDFSTGVDHFSTLN